MDAGVFATAAGVSEGRAEDHHQTNGTHQAYEQRSVRWMWGLWTNNRK